MKRSSASRISTCDTKVDRTGPDSEHRCFTHTSSRVDNDVEGLGLFGSRLLARDNAVLTRHVKKDATVPVPSLAPSLCKLTHRNDSTYSTLFNVNFERPDFIAVLGHAQVTTGRSHTIGLGGTTSSRGPRRIMGTHATPASQSTRSTPPQLAKSALRVSTRSNLPETRKNHTTFRNP